METVRKTRKLPEQVADKLREMIIQESLKTGAKLPAEAELMERFGVSRSTVREAVKILQTEHIVDIRQVLNHARAVGQKRGRHNRYGRILISAYGHLADQWLAAMYDNFLFHGLPPRRASHLLSFICMGGKGLSLYPILEYHLGYRRD